MAQGGEDILRAVVPPMVAAAGFDLEDLTVRPAGRMRVVRVTVDRDGGVDLDAAAALSHAISQRLDASGDAVLDGQPYTLEVTSPGLGRPLTELRHFRRAAGRLATVTRRDGSSSLVRIAGIAGDDVQVCTGADGRSPERIPLADIASARIEPEFTPVPAAVAALVADLAGAPHAGAADEGDGAP